MKYAVVIQSSNQDDLEVTIHPSIEKAEEALINKYRALVIHLSNTGADFNGCIDSKEEDGYIHSAFVYERKETSIDSIATHFRLGIVKEQ